MMFSETINNNNINISWVGKREQFTVVSSRGYCSRVAGFSMNDIARVRILV